MNLSEDSAALESLNAFANTLTIPCPLGEKHVAMENSIAGRTYVMDDNSLGMKTVRFEFTEDGGVFAYENATGKHELKFALGEQLETTFPETRTSANA